MRSLSARFPCCCHRKTGKGKATSTLSCPGSKTLRRRGLFTLRHRSRRCSLPRSQILRRAVRLKTFRNWPWSPISLRGRVAWSLTSGWAQRAKMPSGPHTIVRAQRGTCLPSAGCEPPRPVVADSSIPHRRCQIPLHRTWPLDGGHTYIFWSRLTCSSRQRSQSGLPFESFLHPVLPSGCGHHINSQDDRLGFD